MGRAGEGERERETDELVQKHCHMTGSPAAHAKLINIVSKQVWGGERQKEPGRGGCTGD